MNYKKTNVLDCKAIIFTSANAVKFLDVKKIDKKILCFCVGNATDKKARSVGFQNVIAAEGNVRNLKELILQNFNQKDGKIIYVSGEIISVDLDQQLLKEGYNIERIINYRTTYNENFDENFVKDLKLSMPDIVYIYSQNSASNFLNFIKIHQSENLWMNTNLMCMGEKTSAILNEIKWKKIFLFNPGEEVFLLYKI
jgi:uroporphyrinogen-III synthase